MIHLGIDPGQSGGIACESTIGKEPVAVPMPETERDIFMVLQDIHGLAPGNLFAYIEKVAAHPKHGTIAGFKLGRSYGFLRGCLVALKIPFEEVHPGVWQRSLGCLSGGDKKVTRQRAQNLFPHNKVTHKVADALLIMEFGRRLRSKQETDDARASTAASP